MTTLLMVSFLNPPAQRKFKANYIFLNCVARLSPLSLPNILYHIGSFQNSTGHTLQGRDASDITNDSKARHLEQMYRDFIHPHWHQSFLSSIKTKSPHTLVSSVRIVLPVSHHLFSVLGI